MVETPSNLQKISGPDADKYKGIPPGSVCWIRCLPVWDGATLIILAARPVWARPVLLNIATRVAMQQKVPVAIFSLK